MRIKRLIVWGMICLMIMLVPYSGIVFASGSGAENVNVMGRYIDSDDSDQGDILVSINRDETAPNTELEMSRKELIDIVLTEEEKEAVENGATAYIWLDIADATNMITEESKNEILSVLEEITYEIGQYIDISMYKRLSTQENATPITETSQPIKIKMTVPDPLQKKGRKYAVIRNHEGNVQLLPTEQTEKYELNFETKFFSDYAIAYQDSGILPDSPEDETPTETPTEAPSTTPGTTPNQQPGGNSGASQGTNPVKTGDDTNMMLWIILLFVGLSGMAGSSICIRKNKK